MENGTKLIYLPEDAGRVTDTGVYLAPGAENVVTVGTHLNAELAEAFAERGILGVYEPQRSDAEASAAAGKEASPAPEKNDVPEMPWLAETGA